ncbi:uncharacterized protein J7T54_000948 [Emericellopsis cladophorae]|uniref:Uncharacterized protein n=1 Tax=Emericellopsis cladophorae TaxID=2686198 RepID=A0A9P9Y473_9HYPO|nr:uncharacterized protein J7T54_000948 [Emericellopsis cladophorae]KAI6782805.1 hypothetical protein J7T54_000948 [Emericellopsis cladophorae]
MTVATAALVFFVTIFALISSPARNSKVLRPWATDAGIIHSGAKPTSSKAAWKDPPKRNMHILLPATQSNVNFCKTLLSMTILGYPNPTILAWGDDDESGGLLGGGSHFAKITRVLEYINNEERRKDPAFEDELVFMLDSFDIWFQLPVHQLLDRYDTLLEQENARVKHRLGKAYEKEGIRSQIVFGAGKRCAPNILHSVACYPTPESPLPMDLRGAATDTVLGYSPWSNYRTRYLNSGYIIGPVRELRPLLERAAEKLAACANQGDLPIDNGYGSHECFRGSDQSIFIEIFGEQEFHRETMRRHHRNKMDDWLDAIVANRPASKPPATHIQGAPINDMLNPEFDHELRSAQWVPDKPWEFGIALDYWSTLGHQTSNAAHDYRYLRHDQPIEEQIGNKGWFDCPGKGSDLADLPEGKIPILAGQEPSSWKALPLYTEICLGVVPVMIHHNSVNKGHREKEWDQVWWHGRARELLEWRRTQGAPQLVKGIPAENGPVLKWEELCPADIEPELFRDGNQD